MKYARTLLLGLGLTESESLVYETLHSLEATSIRKIAEACGLDRGAVHGALKSLRSVGLVRSTTRGSRDYYEAESTDKVLELLQEKKDQLATLSSISKKALEELSISSSSYGSAPVVKFYEHDEGLAVILKDVLATCNKLPKREYIAYSSKPLREYLYRRFPSFTEERIKNKIFVRVIAVGSGGDKALKAERKWLANDTAAEVASYTIIYGNKVAIISISSNYTPYGVVIEEQGMANMQRLLFEQLWQTL